MLAERSFTPAVLAALHGSLTRQLAALGNLALVIVDIGGAPTADGGRIRPKLVYRIRGGLAAPDKLAPLDDAGLRSVVDLRAETEDRSVVRDWADATGVRYVAQPMPAGNKVDMNEVSRQSSAEATDYMQALYRRIVVEFGPQITATIGVLAEGLPAGYGCAAGKDRTGIVTAMLHVLLGVSREEAGRRYMSDAPTVEALGPLARDYLDLHEAEPLPVGVEVMMGTMPESIGAALDQAEEEFGSVPAYLEHHGLAPGAVETLRSELVED